MVGYNPNDDNIKLSTAEYGFAGSVSGVCTRVVCQPLDVIKIRFQLQVEPLKQNCGKYHGIFQATKVIVKEEGTSALWKGHVPAQGLSVIFGVVQFAGFEFLSQKAFKYLPEKLTREWYPVTNFICGGTAGSLAITASLPMDVIRTRLIAQGEPKHYHNFRSAVIQMYRREGILSFYRGFVPTLLQVAPYTGCQFMFYSIITKLWNIVVRSHNHNKNGRFELGAFGSLCCGSVAGIGAKMVVYPMDLLKKRLQVIGFEHARESHGRSPRYKGLIDCIKTVFKEEGFKSFFKGLSPGLVKAAAATGFSFLFYEETCKLLKKIQK